MTKGEKVGRTVPAERANPFLITLFPSFNELLTHRGAEGAFFFFLSALKSSPESSLMVREERKGGCAKVEQKSSWKAETSWKVVPCGSAHSVSRKISQQILKIVLFYFFLTKMSQAAPNRGFQLIFRFFLKGLFLGVMDVIFTFLLTLGMTGRVFRGWFIKSLKEVC